MIAVGVPDISPVEESNTSPTGSEGLTVQDVTTPPVLVGVIAFIVEFLASDNRLGV